MIRKPPQTIVSPRFGSSYPSFQPADRFYRMPKSSGLQSNRLIGPQIEAPSRNKLCFVVHEHQAQQAGLHYDFRLQQNGTLWGWMLQQPPPQTSGRSCLAIRVADHPLSYLRFEGTIPAGQYGAGTVKIWDHGGLTWQRVIPSYRFTLQGNKLQGAYALIPFENDFFLVKEAFSP